jgi:hypothetical protein
VTEAEKHIMQIQSLELRLQSQSRSLETRHWDLEALKEEVTRLQVTVNPNPCCFFLTRLQGALEMSQSLVETAQQQAARYALQMEAAHKSVRCKCVGKPVMTFELKKSFGQVVEGGA